MDKTVNLNGEKFDIKMFMNEYKLQDKKEEFQEEYEKIELKENIENLLFDYQTIHLKKILNILKKKNTVLDGSDTGTGKTFIASAIAKQLNLQPFIICPKTIMSNWKNVLNIFNVKALGVVNYETLKLGKYYNYKLERVECPFIEMIKKDNKNLYRWNLPKNVLLIFDEVHQCRNINSQNTQLLISSKKNNIKTLLISATLSESIESFGIFGFMLNLYDNIKKVNKWVNSLESVNTLHEIHKKIYPFNGARMKISELGDKFPKNQISINTYDMDDSTAFIQKEYNEIEKALKTIKTSEKSNALSIIMKSRQKIEILKIPTFIDLIKQYLEENYSIVVFVNFNKTLELLCENLKTKCVVNGGQSKEIREKNINEFVTNKEKIIICNIKAGGVGISLGDKIGENPRISLISPTWSSTDFKQCLGRIYRADSKSHVLQRIICCSNTIEEKMCDRINYKLDNISKINDGDLLNYNPLF